MKQEKIDRINELYRKAKAEGLTQAERTEQQILRREYIDSVKNNLKGQLDHMIIEKPDGTRIDLGEKYGNKKGH